MCTSVDTKPIQRPVITAPNTEVKVVDPLGAAGGLLTDVINIAGSILDEGSNIASNVLVESSNLVPAPAVSIPSGALNSEPDLVSSALNDVDNVVKQATSIIRDVIGDATSLVRSILAGVTMASNLGVLSSPQVSMSRTVPSLAATTSGETQGSPPPSANQSSLPSSVAQLSVTQAPSLRPPLVSYSHMTTLTSSCPVQTTKPCTVTETWHKTHYAGTVTFYSFMNVFTITSAETVRWVLSIFNLRSS